MKTDGTAACWGQNDHGQLGLGNATQQTTPQTVTGITNVASLVLGRSHTCALKNDGTVDCWGYNEYGQLGLGTTTNETTPQALPAFTIIDKLTAGGLHTCAVKTDGTAACWGHNGNGQLGTGTLIDAASPQSVNSPLLTAARASLGTAALPAGAHDITAHYLGDTGFDASASSPAVDQVVNAAPTTTQLALTGGSNPSVFGQEVTLTATVTSGGGTPTGDVTFWDGDVSTGTNLGTVALDGSGVATLAIATLSVASHDITAQYIGTGSFTGSTSGVLAQQVNQGATTLALVPSASSIVFGSSVTLTATVSVTAPAAGTPGGTVTFFDGATEIGTGTLAGGVATLTTSTLSGGGHSLTAVYGGDGNFAGATSAAASVTVTPAPTTTTVITSPNPSKFGERVMMTATVASAAGTPQGTVTFLLDSNAIETRALNANGKANIGRTALMVGSYSLTAVYDASPNFATSTSAAVTHVVEKVDTTTVLAPTTSPTLPGEAVTLTATVSVVAPGGGRLAGRVRFRAGNRFLGSADLSGNTATLTTSDIVTGDHVLTAEYLGNTRHNGSVSDGVAHSVDPRVGPEFRVNTTTAGAQDRPAIAALNGGGFVVAWSSNGQDGSGRGIYAQRYDASAAPLDVEHRVNTTTADQQSYPAIAPLLDGGYVVVWESRLQDGSGYGVYAQRYNSTGGTVGGEVQVNTTTVSMQNRPAVAGLSDGGFVVVWRSYLQDGSRYGIYAQRYGAGGATFGTETLVNTTTAGHQLDPAVTALSNAGFMVVWRSIALDGTAEGIFAQRFDTLNAPEGTETQVNTTPSTRFLEPDVALLANGEVMVVWAALSSDNTSYNVDAQRFDADGNATGGEFRVDTRRGGPQRQPAITSCCGGFMVTWASRNQDGSGYGVYAQRFDSIAQPVDVEFPVNTTTENHQWQPAIAALSSTETIVVWTSVGQDGASGGIYGQRLQVILPAPAAVQQSASGSRLLAAE